MTVRKIERSDGRGIGQQQLLANSIDNFISHEKKVLVATRHLQSIKTLLTLELSQYSKSGSTVSSNKPVAALSDYHRLGIALCLISPVKPAQPLNVWQCWAPRARLFILQSKP